MAPVVITSSTNVTRSPDNSRDPEHAKASRTLSQRSLVPKCVWETVALVRNSIVSSRGTSTRGARDLAEHDRLVVAPLALSLAVKGHRDKQIAAEPQPPPCFRHPSRQRNGHRGTSVVLERIDGLAHGILKEKDRCDGRHLQRRGATARTDAGAIVGVGAAGTAWATHEGEALCAWIAEPRLNFAADNTTGRENQVQQSAIELPGGRPRSVHPPPVLREITLTRRRYCLAATTCS